jgi:hypothetical protein
MNLRDFRIGWRLLARQPAYSCVIVFGLAVGFGVLNARAAVELGFDSPEAAVGQTVYNRGRVVGIAPDLRFQTLKPQPEPVVFRVNEEQGVFTVRASGDMRAAREAVEAAWARHFPNDPPDVESAASIFAQNYSEDLRLAKILGLASIVATTLACTLDDAGQVALATQKRTPAATAPSVLIALAGVAATARHTMRAARISPALALRD